MIVMPRTTSFIVPAIMFAALSQPTAVLADEPTEAELRNILTAQYESIAKAGGAKVTMTATGQQLTLRPKLHEVRKEKCDATPHLARDSYECNMIVKISLNNGKPGEQGERVWVKRNASGDWVTRDGYDSGKGIGEVTTRSGLVWKIAGVSALVLFAAWRFLLRR